MSIIIAQGEVISKSPMNTSKSKMMYSFPKTQRFFSQKKNLCDTIYTFPEVRTTRSTTFGFGNKYDFTKTKSSVPYYNLPTDFDSKKPYLPSYTFGISRSYYEKVYYETNKIIDDNIPGPGKYNHLKPFGHDALKYSLYSRRGFSLETDKSKIPGPGHYKVTFEPDNKYPSSTMKSISTIMWSNSKSNRFMPAKSTNPGPGSYDESRACNFNGTGMTYWSKIKSSTAKSLYSRPKEINNKNQTPGPGSYKIFSEFGQYESKNAKAFEEKYYKISAPQSTKNTERGTRILKEKKFTITAQENKVNESKINKSYNTDYKPSDTKPTPSYIDNYKPKKEIDDSVKKKISDEKLKKFEESKNENKNVDTVQNKKKPIEIKTDEAEMLERNTLENKNIDFIRTEENKDEHMILHSNNEINNSHNSNKKIENLYVDTQGKESLQHDIKIDDEIKSKLSNNEQLTNNLNDSKNKGSINNESKLQESKHNESRNEIINDEIKQENKNNESRNNESKLNQSKNKDSKHNESRNNDSKINESKHELKNNESRHNDSHRSKEFHEMSKEEVIVNKSHASVNQENKDEIINISNDKPNQDDYIDESKKTKFLDNQIIEDVEENNENIPVEN